MKRLTLLSTVFVFAALAPMALAGDQTNTSTSEERITRQVGKEIRTLSNYGVFDEIQYTVEGDAVTLFGYASRPTLKDSAERVIKKIEGVDRVINQIDVLPLSPMDDSIRARAYAAIYGDVSLSRYNPNRGTPIWITPARIANGITNDPPLGNHPIHIIVDKGNILLTGVVDNRGDRDRAGIIANGVFGAFSVKNDLRVGNS